MGRVADAVGGFTDRVAKVAFEEKEKADDIRVQDAYAQAIKRKNERFWDPKAGVIARRGRDAAGVVDEFGPMFEKDLSDIEDTLSNAEQKAQFRNIRSRLTSEFGEGLMKHSFQESEKFADDTYKSVIENTVNDAAVNFAQDGKVGASLVTLKGAAIEYAKRKGMDAEQTRLEEGRVTSGLHRAVIDQMLSAKLDLKAKEYFDANKDAIVDKDDKKAAMDAVNEGYTRGEAQRKAGELYDSNKGNLKQALDNARKISNPDVQAATVAEIKMRHSEMEAIRQDSREKTFRSASLVVEQSKERPEPKVWNSLSLEERNALDNRIKFLREGREVVTDMPTYYEVKQLASHPATMDQFKKTNLMLYQTKIGKTELKELIELQAGLRRGDEKTKLKLDGIQTHAGIVDQSIRAMGINPSEHKDDDEAKRVANFRRMVDQEVMAIQQKTGKEVTNDEVQEVVDKLTSKVVIEQKFLGADYLWPDSEKTSFEVQIDDVPSKDRAAIEAALKASGAPVTDANIIHVFRQNGKRGK